MMKKNNRTTLLTTLVCLIPLAAGLLLYNRMPEQVVIHWDGAGNPNGWASRFTAVFVLPGSIVLLNLIFPLLLKIDPKYKNMNEKVKKLLHWTIPTVGLFASGITFASAMGIEVGVSYAGTLFMGLIFVIIGNFMPKMTQSYTVGIKVPWTLADEENWSRTHRMAGFVWVAGGIVLLIGGFLRVSLSLCMIVIIVLVLAPIIYSFLLYQKMHKEEE